MGKKGRKRLQTNPSILKTAHMACRVNIVRLAEPIRRCVRWRTQVFKIEGFVCKRFLPSSPAFPTFIFLALVSFLARPKPRIPFHGLSLLRNQTETLATQAKLNVNFTIGLIQPNNNETCFLKDYHISDPLWIYNTPYPGTVISTIPHTKC